VEPLEDRRLLSLSHATPAPIVHQQLTREAEIRTYGSVGDSIRVDSKPIASSGVTHHPEFAIHELVHRGRAHPVGSTGAGAPHQSTRIAAAARARVLTAWGSLDRVVQPLTTVEPLPAPVGQDTPTGSNGAAAGPGNDAATGPGSAGAYVPAPDPGSPAQPLTISVLAAGETLMNTLDQVVIRNQAAWQFFYTEHFPGLSPPPVDFSQEMVVAIIFGAQTSGCSVTLDSVTATPSQVTVTYTVTLPGPGVGVFFASTDSYALAAVPRTDPSIPVVFQWSYAGLGTGQA
jgi:hypothetical protein